MPDDDEGMLRRAFSALAGNVRDEQLALEQWRLQAIQNRAVAALAMAGTISEADWRTLRRGLIADGTPGPQTTALAAVQRRVIEALRGRRPPSLTAVLSLDRKGTDR